MTVQRLIPIAAVFALVACGQGADGGGGPDGPASGADDAGSSAPPAGEVVYQGATTVLQAADRDAPELCGTVAESYPPQCGGLPVAGWDWEAVAHEEAAGVRWGEYLVTGTFDGESLVLTEEPVSTEDLGPSDEGPSEPEIGDPAEDLSAGELQAITDELYAEFPTYVYGSSVDEQHGVAIVYTLLVTPELEAYTAEHFPEGTVVLKALFDPVEADE